MIDPADNLTTPLPVTTDSPIRLRFSMEGGMYAAVLEQDLLDDWVVQTWYEKRHARRGGKIQVMHDHDQGLEQLQKITRRCIQNGYALLD